MTKRPDQQDIQKTALRVPRELHTKIHEAADSNGRSMNAEIVHRLESSFGGAVMPEGLPSAEQAKVMTLSAREKIQDSIKAYAHNQIRLAIAHGQDSALIDFSYFATESRMQGNIDHFTQQYIKPVIDEIEAAGYETEEANKTSYWVHIL